jgi:hypothetical protein
MSFGSRADVFDAGGFAARSKHSPKQTSDAQNAIGVPGGNIQLL